MTDFAHLHLHTTYSFLDGFVRPKGLGKVCRERGITACAVTDHGHMGGALRVYTDLKKAGVKPILGMEAWVGSGHLVLLARDSVGYDNLRHLASVHAHGPLTMSQIAERADGLYALTACVLGHVPAALRARDPDKAIKILNQLIRVFGPENVGVELQFHGPMASLCPQLSELAQTAGVDIVAPNDVHYLDEKDAGDQGVLMAIRQGLRLDDPRLFQHPSPDYWLKSANDMYSGQGLLFRRALDNTLKVAERCNVELTLGKPDLPTFADDEDRVLSNLARDGLKARGLASGEYPQRLVHELAVIQDMGFSGYFLIVQDFCNWAREHGVAVGPGRGSGPGSLVAYVLGITDLDPIEHRLFFERFLNPERVSMPDFDIDFAQCGRQLVIDYVRERWGQDRVGQIATYMTLGPKAAIKDVAKVMGIPFQEINALTKVIPTSIRARTLEEEEMSPFDLAMTHAPDLVQRAEDDGLYSRLLATARNLTGCCRQTGKHAGGVVIGRLPLDHYTPMTADGRTAYDMKDVEAAGLVKFDFLGVKTLDVIDIASRDVGVDPRRLPMDDAAVYDSLCHGHNWGVFQIESPGMTKMCGDLVPTCFDDIVAAVALYRPGPKESGMLDDFIERKHGRQEVDYPHPLVEDVLKDTWGTIVYQEQVMQVAQILAGYTLGGADILRRAMGKKIAEEMHAQRRVFVDGCVKNGVDEELASVIFDAIEKHAAYSFNRSHSAGYALISYQTAWLRHHHPAEFTAALLTIECDDKDVFARYVREARTRGVEFLPPDVNESEAGFRVQNGLVRWGLGAIKGLGEAHLPTLVSERPYADFYDLARRSGLTSQALKILVSVGACDRFDDSRARLMASITPAMGGQRQGQLERASGQMDMGLTVEQSLVDSEPMPMEQRLEDERRALGVYITGHPAESIVGTTPSSFAVGDKKVSGVIVDVFERVAKISGKRWARVKIEDAETHMSLIFFPDAFALHEDKLVVGGSLMFKGHVNDEDNFVVKGVGPCTLRR